MRIETFRFFGLVCLSTLLLSLIATTLEAQELSGIPKEQNDAPHAVFVFTNHGEFGTKNERAGYYLPEAAHPWKHLTDAGYRITFASPKGGNTPVTPSSIDLKDPDNLAFMRGPVARGQLDHTVPLHTVDLESADVLFFVGGYGTMWDFPSDKVIGRAVLQVHNQGGVIAAICHGPAALVGILDENGEPFVKGKRVVSFTIAEEAGINHQHIVPFLLQSRLQEFGATFVEGEKYQSKVVTDGRLVTGQNASSGTELAHAIMKIAGENITEKK